MEFIKRNARRFALEGIGWLLLVAGLAALILPGPGLLGIFAGLALLATQYEWAERRLAPVRTAALKAAADSVKSWPRIISSSFGALLLTALGATRIIKPAVPGRWPIADRWWLTGGLSTGVALIVSGLLTLAMIVYSFVHFRQPEKQA